MDTTCLFSAFSLLAVIIYMYVGVYTFKQNIKSIIHRLFLALCTSYAVWSFAYAFAYASSDRYIFSFWNKISAIGWCSFSAISLYLVLLITDNKIARNKAVTILIFFPGALFLYMAVFLFGVNIQTPLFISNFFYIGDFLYNFIYLLISIIILFLWGLRSDSKRIKRQSAILVISSFIPFCLNLLTQTIMPLIGYSEFPLMGQLYSLIMILGIYIVITRYKFLILPETFLLEEVGTRIMDMVILVNVSNEIVRFSKHTVNLLGYKEHELLNKNINVIFSEGFKKTLDTDIVQKKEEKYLDVEIIGKYGKHIPANINYIPIIDRKINDFLGAVLIMQDISAEHELRRINEELHEKTIRDSLTNLYNHQYSMEIIKNEIQELSDNKDLCLMMIDIDHFKRVNDTYGHVYGDYVLEVVSGILIKNISDKDSVGRFGGEEFIVVLPYSEISQACHIGEKIRSGIESHKFDNDLKLTVSIGIKQLKNESPMQLVKNADDLLYKAKQSGRNRIEYSL